MKKLAKGFIYYFSNEENILRLMRSFIIISLIGSTVVAIISAEIILLMDWIVQAVKNERVSRAFVWLKFFAQHKEQIYITHIVSSFLALFIAAVSFDIWKRKDINKNEDNWKWLLAFTTLVYFALFVFPLFVM